MSHRRLSISQVRELATQSLKGVGVGVREADITGRAQVVAECGGFSSHGLAR
ncbi:Ldh family oxidoreductase [Salinicola acroporae]|uniref:Ldh family oxidoreductase n=1 Tax=Salinicola acroporae TaxID=1541440 RepID=UPI0013A5FB67|nr:Ldh family oxidoreductase [Salinicola acroporae]